MRKSIPAITALVLALAVVQPAAAYVGPGAGLSMLGAFWGLLLAVFAAIGFVLLWPLRKLMRRNRAKGQGQAQQQARAADHGSSSRVGSP